MLFESAWPGHSVYASRATRHDSHDASNFITLSGNNNMCTSAETRLVWHAVTSAEVCTSATVAKMVFGAYTVLNNWSWTSSLPVVAGVNTVPSATKLLTCRRRTFSVLSKRRKADVRDRVFPCKARLYIYRRSTLVSRNMLLTSWTPTPIVEYGSVQCTFVHLQT